MGGGIKVPPLAVSLHVSQGVQTWLCVNRSKAESVLKRAAA